jgi:endonuclease I
MKTIINLLLFLFAGLFSSWAQIPDGYYDDAIGKTGEDLKAALHEIIDDHVEYSYGDLRDFILPESDEDPDNSDNVLLLYSGVSRDKDDFGGNNGQWNREHVWAKSHGDFDNYPPEGTDAHHVRACDVRINNIRGNLDFDNGGSPVDGAPGCKADDNSFEPHDDFKGDVARMIFYMAVRYEGGNGELDLEVVDLVNNAPNPLHGKLSTLMDWHEDDPPDDFEMNRNEVVFDYQENRNPFIDHPEFVEDIWGDPVDINEHRASFIVCFPNPFETTTVIRSNKETFNFEVISTDGHVVAKGLSKGQQTALDLSNHRSGLYLLRIYQKNGEFLGSYKLIKRAVR